jgi:hypothetical protein
MEKCKKAFNNRYHAARMKAISIENVLRTNDLQILLQFHRRIMIHQWEDCKVSESSGKVANIYCMNFLSHC